MSDTQRTSKKGILGWFLRGAPPLDVKDYDLEETLFLQTLQDWLKRRQAAQKDSQKE